jgi:predicted alpha-1,2-mannosidase
MLDPRVFQDVNGEYIGGDQKVHKPVNFTKRTIFSGWDVFRSQIPLQTIINPSLVNDLVNSLVTLADESGKHYLERWEFLNAYSGCMIGNPGVSVLAEAYAKGIRNFDVEKAYQYARNSVEKFGNGNKGFSSGGLSISNTLEYTYADWCMYRLARNLGKDDDSAIYLKRSFAYKNIFDAQKGWFRPKNEDGKWEAWPLEGRLKQWYGTIECNPYQQGWFVPHDVDGMVNLMGGRAKVVNDLEYFFQKTPLDFRWNDYYNHANEPVHHVPFLFNRLGAPWLTQKWTRTIVDNAYHNSVEGIVGNEDVGQMSAWYVLAASGLHPVCPADTRYEITSPLFNSVVLHLDKKYSSGSSFTLKAINNSRKNIYIQKATLNGKPYNRCSIDYADIRKGGELVLYMGTKPNKAWGISK